MRIPESLRARWYGHVHRREKPTLRRVTRWKPCRRRSRGQPGVRWVIERSKNIKEI